MYTLRRWWDRHGIQFVIASLAIGTGWFIRQTQGAAVVELYQSMARPFQTGATPQERIENARLDELKLRLEELEQENKKLQQLLGYSAVPKQKAIAARIIGRSAAHWWQHLTLGSGSTNGIKEGFIVMGTGGLVGRVVSVTSHTSRVLLISDATSRVGVTIGRSRQMGYIRGQTGNRAIMQFFDKVPNVRIGDAVSTSSVSHMFPPGLPIGRVESVSLNKIPAPEAVIELTAPFSSLEWVKVYPFNNALEGTTEVQKDNQKDINQEEN